MHKAAPVAAASAALFVPLGNAVAAARAATTVKKKVVVVTRTISGNEGSAGRWGNVQVTIVRMRKSRTSANESVEGKMRKP